MVLPIWQPVSVPMSAKPFSTAQPPTPDPDPESRSKRSWWKTGIMGLGALGVGYLGTQLAVPEVENRVREHRKGRFLPVLGNRLVRLSHELEVPTDGGVTLDSLIRDTEKVTSISVLDLGSDRETLVENLLLDLCAEGRITLLEGAEIAGFLGIEYCGDRLKGWTIGRRGHEVNGDDLLTLLKAGYTRGYLLSRRDSLNRTTNEFATAECVEAEALRIRMIVLSYETLSSKVTALLDRCPILKLVAGTATFPAEIPEYEAVTVSDPSQGPHPTTHYEKTSSVPPREYFAQKFDEHRATFNALPKRERQQREKAHQSRLKAQQEDLEKSAVSGLTCTVLTILRAD